MMKPTMTLEIPEDVYQSLQKEAAKTGKSLEEIALDWITQHSQLGRAEALMPCFGAWQMTPEERARIERMIDEERHLEENVG